MLWLWLQLPLELRRETEVANKYTQYTLLHHPALWAHALTPSQMENEMVKVQTWLVLVLLLYDKQL